MTRTKRILLTLFAAIGLVVTGAGLAVPAYAASDPSVEAAKASSCAGIGGTYKDGKCETGTASLNGVVANVVNILSWLVGIAAVIMIMVGGFRYVTAGGDSGKLGSAKNTIIYAVIGLVIVALAQTIVKFVIKQTVPPKTAQATVLLLEKSA